MSRASIFLTQLLARQQAGWESEQPVLVEELVQEQPELAARREDLLDLIYAEIHYRERTGQQPTQAEYAARFPQFTDELNQLFEIHAALGGEASLNLETHDSRSQINAAGETQVYQAAHGKTASSAAPAASRYQIVRPHAKGGLGEVFVAKDLELGREVALKQIQTRYADYDESRGRFVLEAEITGGLEHPGIVPVYGLGQDAQGRPYYAMRFIRGISLEESITKLHANPEHVYTRSGQPTGELRKLLQRFIDVCNAIGYAHSRGIIHRDLKPANVMLGNYGETLVVDWGLAKSYPKQTEISATDTAANSATATVSLLDVKQSDLTQDGSTLGTPAYMSPEQAGGQTAKLGPASDIYCLGATLYCLLTGQPPHRVSGKEGLAELLRRVQAGEFPRPRDVQKRVQKALEAICLRAMAVEPAQRYSSCQDLSDDLEHFLADEPVAAKRETLVEQFGRLTRRHRGAFLAGTAALVLLTVGSIAALLIINAAKEKESAALAQETVAKKEAVAAQKAAEQATARERTAKDEIARKAKQLERGNDLLAGIFEDLDLRKADTGTTLLPVLLQQKLIAAAQKLEQDSVGDPLAVSLLQNQLGMALLNLGETTESIILFQKSLEETQKRLGEDHHETLIRMNNLAQGYRAAGSTDLALPLLEKTFKLSKSALGADHSETLIRMNNLAQGYQLAGKLDLALPLFEETLKVKKARLTPDHPSTLSSMNNLAVAYQAAGQLDLALPLLQETLALTKAKFGLDHPDTLSSSHNLANGYLTAGQYEQALPLLEETTKLMKAKLGPDHPDTLISMNNLASGYRSVGKLELAMPLLEETLRLQKVKLGLDHPATLTSMSNLASGYFDAGKLDLALPLSEETLKLMKLKLGPDHPDTLSGMENLAVVYAKAGKSDLVLPLHEETFRLRKAKLGLDHPDTINSMGNLAERYRAEGKLDMALPLLEETLKLRKSKLGPDHPNTLISMNNLAGGYEALGRHNLALPLLEESLKLMKVQFGPDHPTTLHVMNNLAEQYGRASKFHLALPLWQETLNRRKSKLGLDHPDTLVSMNNLAQGYRSMGKLDLALPLLEETLKLRKKKLGLDHPQTLKSMGNLGGGYFAAGKDDLALPLLEETYQRCKTIFGNEHPDTLSSMENLADSYFASGKFDLALPLLEETHKQMKAKFGPNDLNTLQSMAHLADVYQATGRLNLALPLLEETLKLMKVKLGPEHPNTIICMARLAEVYNGTEKFELALPLLEQALKQMKTKLGPDHPLTLACLNNLAISHAEMKHGENAAKYFVEHTDILREKLLPNDLVLGGGLGVAGFYLLKCGEFGSAEKMLRESHTISKKSAPNDWSTPNTQAMLGRALLGQEKYDEAAPLLLEGYNAMKERQAKLPPPALLRMAEALDALIELAKAQDKLDEMEKWEAERKTLDAAIQFQSNKPRPKPQSIEPKSAAEKSSEMKPEE